MLQEKKRSALIGIVGGSVLQVAAYAAILTSTSLTLVFVGAIIGLVGFVMLMYGSASFSSGKGYPGWLGALLVFLLSWVGLLIVAVLPDKMKRGGLSPAPLMAQAGAYDPGYGSAPHGSPTAGPAYGTAPAFSEGLSPYQAMTPGYATTTGYGGGNGHGASGLDPVALGGTASSFDQPAPEFSWEPGLKPVSPAPYDPAPIPETWSPTPPPAPTMPAAPVPAPAMPAASMPAPAMPATVAFNSTPPGMAPPLGGSAAGTPSNWPPAGHWSLPPS